MVDFANKSLGTELNSTHTHTHTHIYRPTGQTKMLVFNFAF